MLKVHTNVAGEKEGGLDAPRCTPPNLKNALVLSLKLENFTTPSLSFQTEYVLRIVTAIETFIIMVEIFATVAAALGLLEQSIKLIGRIKDARKDSSEHFKTISEYLDDLEMTKDNLSRDLELIKKIEILKSENVEKCAESIKRRSGDLQKLVSKVSEDGGFWHKFFSGKSGIKDMETTKDRLGDAERHLQDALRAVTIGLTVEIHQNVQRLVVDKALVVETNAEVQKVLGKERELDIAKIIKDKVPDDNGKVILDKEERDKLEQLAEATGGKKVTIRKNTARHQALQFNAPIGTDLWKDLDQLDIHDNTAENQSRQFNYAQTMDVYHDQMARAPKPLDYTLIAVLVAAIAVIYIVFGK